MRQIESRWRLVAGRDWFFNRREICKPAPDSHKMRFRGVRVCEIPSERTTQDRGTSEWQYIH